MSEENTVIKMIEIFHQYGIMIVIKKTYRIIFNFFFLQQHYHHCLCILWEILLEDKSYLLINHHIKINTLFHDFFSDSCFTLKVVIVIILYGISLWQSAMKIFWQIYAIKSDILLIEWWTLFVCYVSSHVTDCLDLTSSFAVVVAQMEHFSIIWLVIFNLQSSFWWTVMCCFFSHSLSLSLSLIRLSVEILKYLLKRVKSRDWKMSRTMKISAKEEIEKTWTWVTLYRYRSS